MNTFTQKLLSIASHAADRLPEVLLTVIFGIIVIEIVIFIFSRALRIARVPAALRRILESLGRTFLWIILFLAVIQTLGLNNVIVAVTGSSVIVALFLSTGVAPVITDILAGIFLTSDRQFQPGATVKAGSQDTEGVIEDMDLRKVRLRGRDGRLHVIPNSIIEANEWVIIKPRPRRRKTNRI